MRLPLLLTVALLLAGCAHTNRPLAPKSKPPEHYRLQFADGTTATNMRTVEISSDRIRGLRTDALEAPMTFSEHPRDSLASVERCSWPERGTSPYRAFTLAGGLAGMGTATYLANKHARGHFLGSIVRYVLYVPVGILVGTSVGYAIERSTEPIEEQCRTVWRSGDGPASFY